MRIIGDIPHPTMKITVFKNDGKLSVKFESGLIEQIYKFRDDERLQTFEDVQKVVDEAFIQKTEEMLMGMYDIKQAALNRHLAIDEEEFEKII